MLLSMSIESPHGGVFRVGMLGCGTVCVHAVLPPYQGSVCMQPLGSSRGLPTPLPACL